ncbi:hypothetical protein KP509_15G038000 [Ceratopteris richardii]|uniref:Sacsin/Nov domain-containing protein n=1 Tax=Ceratopteris richardii TaxID=49495 RepID=A0A8T2T3I7_CERRI|nr:hypothetical protein KP509_15G038000 [Ceratopteris richardii]
MAYKGTASPQDIAEDFGQKVDLTRRIREILANYPEGTTVLKELIQNADDAGATEVSFCLDRRKHGADSMLYEGLSPWQGPAVLAFNNAEFSAQDFESISKLGGSKKGREPWKTGRFGVGFNSVYHLSDLPSFVSGRHIVYFDPHCKFLPNISSVNPGKRIDFVKSSALSYYKDQFTPYCMFGCDMKAHFQGTIFRFPLRTVRQAAESQLSKQHYKEENIIQLFDELCEEASLCMLFLKNVEVIRFYDWHPDNSSPFMLCSCSLTSLASQTRWQRHALTRLADSWTSFQGNASKLKYLESFILEFNTEKSFGNKCRETFTESFMIVQCMDTPISQVGILSSLAAKEYGVCLLPWVAVAAKISGTETQVSSGMINDGKAFCFLPLPLRTNLPVHVNGFFELSSNRRDIWHGADMDGMGKIRASWNMLLLNDVIASAYYHLLMNAPEDARLNYTFWPSETFSEPWKSMVDSFYEGLSKYPVLHSDIDGGRWLTLPQSVLHDYQMPNFEKQTSILLALGLPLVCMPHRLFQIVSNHCDAKIMCPNLLRQHLKHIDVNQCGNHLQWESGLDFLDYCLGDVLDEDAARDLSGIPLVPLANGKFGVFGDKDSTFSYLLCNEKQYFLLEKVNHMIVSRNIPQVLLQRIHQMTELSSVNISFMNITGFVNLLDKILPAEWKGKDVVKWIPEGQNHHPSRAWLTAFWEYLNDYSEDLNFLGSWPLIPANEGLLCSAKKGLGIIRGDGSLSKNLEHILIDIGCYIMRSDICIGHSWLSKCVQSPTAMGVLDAISCVVLNKGHAYKDALLSINPEQRRELRSFLLDEKWYRGNLMKEPHLHILRSLPVFETYDKNRDEKCFIDLQNSKLYFPPPNVDVSLLGADFLHTESQMEIEVLSKSLGIRQMERAAFYKLAVIGKITALLPVIRDQAMLSILKELPFLCLEDPDFKNSLISLSFVPTPSGDLQPPRCLYDPRIKEFQVLLDGKQSFPSDAFRKHDVLDALQMLGLQTSVSPNTILESARQVEYMLKDLPDEACIRGFFLLSYLEANAVKLFPSSISDGFNSMLLKVGDIFQTRKAETDVSRRFWSELASICWCPVLVQPPHPGLPWPSATAPLAPPRLVRLPADLWLVSASMRILNGDCRSAFLSEKLGWTSHLGGNVLAAQLLELGRNQAYAGSQGLKQALATVIPRMYALLSEKIGTEEIEIVKTVLEGSEWVWVGDKFVCVHDVVLSGPLHLAPYLWVVPADLAVFKELLVELGVKESLTVWDYSNLLSKIAKVKSNISLDSLELKTVIWILQHLTDLGFAQKETGLFVPDTNGILLPSSELVYNDAPWLLGDPQEGGSALDSVIGSKSLPNFVHANISNDVAEKLNIRSLRRLVLSESADSLNLTLHGAAEAFGQHEALTTRLKHIVDMYVDGPGILCELLQNSDDAGASEVSFLLDLTYYGTSSLLAPRMAEWQGPALYCFNNAVFTSKDLHAISRIGQDSKIDKPHAVGRFGLGFNSVYHFTDLPAFVSGNSLVIFDPHACHLPGISPSHPGLKINYVGKGLVQQFPDQCHPYTLFGCDLQHFYNGTLFRFPLRSSSAASRSQIKQMAYTPEMVFSLFQDFQIVASEVLLFLHNVTNITLYSKEGLDHEMRMLYKVSKRCDAQKNSVYTFVRSLKEKSKNKDDFYKNLKDIRDDSLPSDCQLIHITTDEAKRRYTQSWIVSEYLGGKQAVRMATRSENRIHGFVPWAGIAAKMGAEVNSFSSSSSSLEIQSIPSCFKSIPVEGRAFCFLPLPVKTGLPVHVNAYFELSSNRRDIWFGDDMAGGGKLRSEWNQCLLKEVASSAYVRMLAWAARESGSSEDYYFLWPTNMLSEPWAALSSGIYVLAAEMDLPLLFTNANSGRWIPPSKAIFPDFSYSQMMELGSALTDARLSLVNTPTSLVDQFKKYCPTLRYLTPQLMRSLLIRCPNAMQGREAALTALRYCLSDIQTVESLEKLEGLPLLPLANGAFETFTCLSTSEKVFFVDKLEFDLLKDTKLDRLVDRCLGPELLEGLHAIAEFESTNIALLSPVLLKDLLPDILPQDWYGKSLVHWTMAESGHPTRSWIELLWKFLCLHSADLSLFAEWPLLPTQDEQHLLQPIKGSCILMSENWSENMVSLIKKANCYLLSSSVHIDHPQLRDYVHDVSASGLLGAFFAAAGGFEGLQDILKHISELEMQELRGFLMQRRWFVDGSMNAFHVEILKHLPIFKTFKTSSYVSLMKGINFIPPKDVDVHLLGNEFICAGSDKEEEILTNSLGIKKLEKSEFFTNYDFENLHSIQPGLQEKVILNLLQDFRLLEKEVPCIREVLSKVAIIPTAHGELKSPKELYDPRVLELHSLLGDSFFPSSVFSVVNVLDVLLDLGLKTSLGLEDLLDSAISVAARSRIDENHALNMGKCLLAHINKLGLSLEMSAANRVISEFNFDSEAYVLHQEEKSSNEEGVCLEDFEKPQEPNHTLSNEGTERQFWLKLRDIKWCPALNKAPHLFLPWPREPKSLLVPPIVVRPKSQMWHVSSTMCILDGEFNSRLMMSRLGWLEKPNLTVLAMQVIELSRHHTDIQSQSSFESTTEETNAGIEQFNKILDEVIPSIYRLMEELLTSDNVIILKSMFENVCWVWVGDAFVSPKQAAFISPSHFQPYLHTIPANLSVFRALLSVMGVKDTFDVLDFAHVLEQVSNDRQGKALTKELLDFVIRMLEAIDDILSMDDTVADQRLLSTILVPNATGFLMPAKDLIYNDAPWLTQSVHGRADIKYFVHPDVPNGLVDKLGAKSLRYLSFVDKEMTKDLPCLVLPDILTVLSKCGGKLNLLFDLLEIADKCKAKKMHVLYDKRVHSQISILQPNLGQYQGPALTVAFEGAELTTEEVCNLQLSPSWSRRGHHNNYGAGLLSCYTIADILLLVSKGCLYIFDPSGTILASSFTSGKSSAIRSAQGKVYTLKGTDIPQKFADQFAPLGINEDIFWGTPNITIFRMPLYTDGASCEEGKDMRNQSSEATVDSILRHFISSASTSLLFLNTIEEVSRYGVHRKVKLFPNFR